MGIIIVRTVLYSYFTLYYFPMQVPGNEEMGLGKQSEECPTDDHEASPSPAGRSTKLLTKHTSTMTKWQKQELQEDIVLQKAVSCKEKVEQNVS